MRILAIESSCDETAISVIEASGSSPVGEYVIDADFHFEILGDMTLSQAKLHAEYGGVFPNLAKREHAKNFVPILEKVLTEANLLEDSSQALSGEQIAELKALLNREPELFELLSPFLSVHARPAIDAIAVTAGPGLEPALWVGINAAKALARIWQLPIVAANHMEGHIMISSMQGNTFGPLNFPALALLISGGHTEMILMHEWMQYEKVGETRDDAVGEAFDKTARLLGLPYPGGPELSRLAHEARTTGRTHTYKFPRPMLKSGDLDFSFSGLKTSVRVAIQDKELSDTDKADVAWAFEDALTEVLVSKVRDAIEKYGIRSLIVGGGVSANTYIRESLRTLLINEFANITLLLPSPKLATDNALMIALAGYFHALKKDFVDPESIIAHGTKQLS